MFILNYRPIQISYRSSCLQFASFLFLLCSDSLFLQDLEGVHDCLLVVWPVRRSIGDRLSKGREKLGRGGGGVDLLTELRVVERPANRLLGDRLTVSLLGSRVSDGNLPQFQELANGALRELVSAHTIHHFVQGSGGLGVRLSKNSLSLAGRTVGSLDLLCLRLREHHLRQVSGPLAAISWKLLTLQKVEVSNVSDSTAGTTDGAIRGRSLCLVQECRSLLGKLESAEHTDLVLRLLVSGLLESSAEAHTTHSSRHLEGHWRAVGVTIDVVRLLVLLDDPRLLLPLLGREERKAPEQLLLSLELELVVLDLFQKSKDVGLALFSGPSIGGLGVGRFLE